MGYLGTGTILIFAHCTESWIISAIKCRDVYKPLKKIIKARRMLLTNEGTVFVQTDQWESRTRVIRRPPWWWYKTVGTEVYVQPRLAGHDTLTEISDCKLKQTTRLLQSGWSTWWVKSRLLKPILQFTRCTQKSFRFSFGRRENQAGSHLVLPVNLISVLW